MDKVFLICPANVVTGGTELAHQLGACIAGMGLPVAMVYHPFDKPGETPATFVRYGVPVAAASDAGPDDIVVFPEVLTSLAGAFPASRRYLWWMSVDNFFVARYRRLGRLLPHRLLALLHIPFLRRTFERHLYQSEYARLFLAQHAIGPVDPLTDYLADEYIDGIAAADPLAARDNMVVYNPRKGAEQSARIAAELASRGRPDISMVALEKMDRAQVKALLHRAKVYIDFGNHPGKDRIPREAAAMGACIIVNRRGSAANAHDVPLPDTYKIDDSQAGFARTAVDRIIAIIDDYPGSAEAFSPYRASIASEPSGFVTEVAAIFQKAL